MAKKCFFTGHRDTPASIKPLLADIIERHISEYGVTEFYVGSHGAFDALVTGVLAGMKQKYPSIHNYVVLAYHPSIKRIDVPVGFECTVFSDRQELIPPRFAVSRLNMTMIADVDYLIAYVWKITAGSYKLMDAAIKLKEKGRLIITNLATSQQA